MKKKQRTMLTELLEAGDKDGEVTIAWNAYQELRLIFYVPHEEGPKHVQDLLNKYADRSIPEIKRLCKTLKKWQKEIIAYFATKGASNGPTEAINGVIETTRRVPGDFAISRLTASAHCSLPATTGTTEIRGDSPRSIP